MMLLVERMEAYEIGDGAQCGGEPFILPRQWPRFRKDCEWCESGR
jgi:hypothetical protein